MRLLRSFVFVLACCVSFEAHAQRSASDIGEELEVFRIAVRDWDADTWQGFLQDFPESSRADTARRALATFDAEQLSRDEALAALDRVSPEDWNCSDMPTLVSNIVPSVGKLALEDLAEAGDPRAQTLIGWSMTDGYLGYLNDYSHGMALLRGAAEQGFPAAQANLGDRVVQDDPEEGVRLQRAAADAGNGCGRVGLGVSYTRGRGGLEVNREEAARLYRLAADQGNAFGMANLGWMYASGEGGLARDDVEAVRLFRMAAEQGNHAGQTGLAVFYLDQRGGLPTDIDEANRLLRLAADAGNPHALVNLGVSYLQGRGVVQDDGLAATRFEEAAYLGYGWGEYYHGEMILAGRGRHDADREAGVFFLQQAARDGVELAQRRLQELGESW